MHRQVEMGKVKRVCIHALNMEQPQWESLNLESYWEEKEELSHDGLPAASILVSSKMTWNLRIKLSVHLLAISFRKQKIENRLGRKLSRFQMRDYVSEGLIIGFGNELLEWKGKKKLVGNLCLL